MKKYLIVSGFLFFCFYSFSSEPKVTIEEYIATWKEVAVLQMKEYQIPASITLAQGILESGFGNSKLAVKANNHFGIKCHASWKGKTFSHDDDKKDECFRKYENALQSYEDHSLFLVNGIRYSFLFDLEVTDYKSWAEGLKKAGYATLPTYPQRLIDLIERYELNQYDVVEETDWIAENKKTSTKVGTKKELIEQENKIENKASIVATHQVHYNENKTKYIVAGKHDTFYLIAKEFGLNLRQLHKWNDFPESKDLLTVGEKVYIMRKRKAIPKHLTELDLSQKQELWSVSQDYGVQLTSLLVKNKHLSNQIALQ